jgi:hypothetical protein
MASSTARARLARGLCSARDGQRARVYAWENRVIGPHDSSQVAFAAAQGFIDAVWTESGLQYPPKVERLPRQTRVLMADATRLRIRLPPSLPAWCLLHEIAHAMTSTVEGASDGHGPIFMGVYVGLLSRYLRLRPDALHASLMQDGIAVHPDARPMFLDPAPG